MRPGLYGKLPSKRDFIAEAVPRGFLGVFEPWLQGAVGASRMALGRAWQQIWLAAPIWRFWIGSAHCGETLLGALMPSVDGVGRYFPLVLTVAVGDDEFVAPPTADRHDAFYGAAEDMLLDALADGCVYEDWIARLPTLPLPATATPPASVDGSRRFADGTLLIGGGGGVDDLIGRVDATRASAGLATATFWWTIGGGDIPAMVLRSERLPDPALFAGFLTGRFDRPA